MKLEKEKSDRLQTSAVHLICVGATTQLYYTGIGRSDIGCFWMSPVLVKFSKREITANLLFYVSHKDMKKGFMILISLSFCIILTSETKSFAGHIHKVQATRQTDANLCKKSHKLGCFKSLWILWKPTNQNTGYWCHLMAPGNVWLSLEKKGVLGEKREILYALMISCENEFM